MSSARPGLDRIRGKATDGPVSRYLNRPVSTRITRLIIAYGVPLTPNQVSGISFALALAAAWLVLTGYYLAAGILVQLSSIIDGVDGELARALGRASRLGGFLDAVLDRGADIAVLASTGYASIITGLDPVYALVLSIAAVTGDLMVSYLHARGEASLGKHPALVGVVPQFASRDVRLLVVAVGLALGLPVETLAVIAILSYAYVVAKTVDVATHYGA